MTGGEANSSFSARAGRALADDTMRIAIRGATDGFPAARQRGLAELDNADQIRDAASATRARTLAQAAELLDELARRLEERGVRVFWAADAGEAADYVRSVCRERSAKLAVKSKSMVSEEVRLNEVLETDGVRVVETDLGEFIVQVAGEPPSHILAPAIHRNRFGVAEVLSADAGRQLEPDPAALTAYAKQRLRQEFLSADVGISGVNFGVAETGTLVLVTNEGNGRMVTALPPVHIALMGLERVVATWEELDVLLALLPRSATGQSLTVYTSLLSGPRQAPEADGPEEMHLVIVDNGRSDVLGSEYREILHCIRCGACLNVCPVYRQVGGHAYGSVYGGPVGAVLTPLLTRQHQDLAGASSLCAACHEVCPVRIPIQDLLLRLRADDAGNTSRRTERLAFNIWSHAWSRPRVYRWSTALAAVAARLGVRLGMRRGPLSGWTATRELPPIPGRSFLEGERRRRKSGGR